MKVEGSTTWYWETTGAEITEFYWGIDQPKYENPFNADICFRIFVHPENNGWYDDMCMYSSGAVMCE